MTVNFMDLAPRGKLTFYITLMGASYGELAETADGDAINRYHVEHIYIIGAMYNH